MTARLSIQNLWQKSKKIACAGLIFSALLNQAMSQEQPQTLEAIQHSYAELVTKVQNPKRIISLDFGNLDTLKMVGLDQSVVGLPKGIIPNYLKTYDAKQYATVGGIVEPDLELIKTLKPDLIIISGRQNALYDKISAIAPTLNLKNNASHYIDSLKLNANVIAQIFSNQPDIQTNINAIFKKIEQTITTAQLKNNMSDKKALILLHNDGKLMIVNSGNHAALIHDVLGFKKVDSTIYEKRHVIDNNYLIKMKPDYIFIIDRSAAIGKDKISDQQLQSIKNNSSLAHSNNAITYLTPDLWYLSSGGLESIQLQIAEIMAAFE